MQADGYYMNLSVESVDVVKNRYLQKQLDKRKRELNKTEGSEVKNLLLLHGTPQENIASILRDNFDLGKRVNGRKYGSEKTEVSVGYTNTGFNIDGKWVGKKVPPKQTATPAGRKSQANPALNAARPSLIFVR